MTANDNKDPAGLIVSYHEDEPATAWIWISNGGSLYPADRDEARRIAAELLAFANQRDSDAGPPLATLVTKTQPHEPVRHKIFLSYRSNDEIDAAIHRQIAALAGQAKPTTPRGLPLSRLVGILVDFFSRPWATILTPEQLARRNAAIAAGQKRAWTNPEIRDRRSAAIRQGKDDPLKRAIWAREAIERLERR